VADFIRARDLEPGFVVVERNGEALERATYETVVLADGDRLELVRAVAGGDDAGRWRRERLRRSQLYVVTDARERRGDLAAFVDAILGAGADLVQLREKDAEAGDLLRWAEVVRRASSRHGALFVVNDRPDVALAVGADGVHVGQNDLPVSFVRELVGPDVLIGLSTHDETQLESAPATADYVCAGPVHPTPTKAGRPATGVGFVRFAADRMDGSRPWFAIGGIDTRTLPDVVEAGATRVAVVRAVTEASDPGAAVRLLRTALPALPGA